MSLPSESPHENLTLTEADLAACRPIVGEGGHVLRALCPFHGSDRQRSLRVQVHSGRFVCFACGVWGYMETARAQWREEQQRQAALQKPPDYRQRVPHRRQPPSRLPRQPVAAARQHSAAPSIPREPTPARPDLAQQLAAFQAALPGSRGEAYLHQRGIPLALAQQLGVGYAAPGIWPHATRDWRGGRVVFPHTTPEGAVVNLYGRAVGTAEQVPKAMRHDHLPRTKGYFNAEVLQYGTGPLWVCEGAFDALALLAAGIPRVVAIYGVQGWCWAWARHVDALSQRSVQVQVSATGTFRSAPHRHEARDVHFAFSGDSEAVFQPFELLQTIQQEHPDFFVYLGDTIYADNDSAAGNVARVAPAESLAVYRAKYRENRADRALQHLLAAVPLYAIWDDHEVRNDFAGETVDRTLYSAGRQAFLEYMPLARPYVPAEAPCAAAPLFRVFHWGSAVQIIVLDERSCRSADVAEVCRHDPLPTLPSDLWRLFGLLDPPPPDCLAALFDPARTMLGALQMEAFKKALLERTAMITFVINQVPIQQFWGSPYDRWEGYAAERQQLLHFIRDHDIEHVIFLTTDTHANLINDVFVDRFTAPTPVAYEFVTGPIGHPTLGRDIFATQGDAGLAGFHTLLNLAGVHCRHLDVLSYGSVDVDATTGTATIMLKDAAGAVVEDQLTSVPCQKTIGPSNADHVLQHGLSESQHALGQ